MQLFGDHVYVYGAVPPLATTLAVPVFAPLQVMLFEAILNVSAGGSVIVASAVIVQLLLSLTKTVYVPATKPLAVAAFPPLGLQV